MQRWSVAAGAAGLVLVTLAIFALTGGFKSDARRAQDAAGAFLSALQRHDRAGVEANITRAAQERGWVNDLAARPDNTAADRFELDGPAQVEGDDARVPVVLTDSERQREPATVLLRREARQWKVRALALRPNGIPLTLDFEHPEAILGDIGRAAGQAFGKAMGEVGRGVGEFLQGISQGLAQSQRDASPPGVK